MNSTEQLTYRNPRKDVVITDWPSGSLRTTATFHIEANKKGERAVRTTINPKTGRINAPKALTYSPKVRFVDGSDGRLYVISFKGTFDFSQEAIFERDPRFASVLALFE